MTGRTSEIVSAFGAVQSEMRRSLGSLDVGAFSETKAGKVKRDLIGSIDTLAVFAARWAVKAVKARYQDEQGKARNRLEMIGAKRNRGFDKRRHAQAMERSSDAILKDYMKATASMKMLVGQYIDGLRRHNASLMQVQEFDASALGPLADEYIGALVTDAIANNKARGWVSSQIMDWLRKNLADGNYITIGTRRFEVRAYSELVARTRMIEAASEATKASCREYDNDLVEFSTHAEPCEACAELEGQVFSISGENDKYPMLTDDVTPPVHPNCEHGLYATSEISMRWK
jgi:hypothetical protein